MLVVLPLVLFRQIDLPLGPVKNVFHGGRDHMRPADVFKQCEQLLLKKYAREQQKVQFGLNKTKYHILAQSPEIKLINEEKRCIERRKAQGKKTEASKKAAAASDYQGELHKKSNGHGESSEGKCLEDPSFDFGYLMIKAPSAHNKAAPSTISLSRSLSDESEFSCSPTTPKLTTCKPSKICEDISLPVRF
jgi:hypothetical protein